MSTEQKSRDEKWNAQQPAGKGQAIPKSDNDMKSAADYEVDEENPVSVDMEKSREKARKANKQL